MNDTELDRLLNTWNAPAPPESMRQRLRARFPQAERIRFARPLRWGLVTLLGSAAIVAAMTHGSADHWDVFMDALYNHIDQLVDAHRTVFIMAEIRHSEPKVYIDGQPAGPLEYGNVGSMRVEVPGAGAYSVMFFRYTNQVRVNGYLSGWTQAGTFHGNVIEFEAGGKQVRIECSQSIIDGYRPVFIRPVDTDGPAKKM